MVDVQRQVHAPPYNRTEAGACQPKLVIASLRCEWNQLAFPHVRSGSSSGTLRDFRG